jgi:tight adherence protein C
LGTEEIVLLAIMGVGVMGATAFFVGYQLFSGELEGAAASRLEAQRKKPSNGIFRLSASLMRSLVLPYSSRIKAEDWKKKMKRTIISAGLEEELDANDVLGFKIFLGFVVPAAIFIYLKVNNSEAPWWIFLGMMLVLYAYPGIYVSGCRKRRHEEVKLQLPFVIDLLTLSTEAGLDFIGALQKVVEKTRSGPLVNEIERMLQQIQLGTTRSEAMRELAWRIDLTEVSSLIAVLVTADQMGSSLGAVLRVQSELIRNQRFTQAEKKGAAASQKLLFPLIFFIMPAVFIMIFGPVILGFLGVK